MCSSLYMMINNFLYIYSYRKNDFLSNKDITVNLYKITNFHFTFPSFLSNTQKKKFIYLFIFLHFSIISTYFYPIFFFFTKRTLKRLSSPAPSYWNSSDVWNLHWPNNLSNNLSNFPHQKRWRICYPSNHNLPSFNSDVWNLIFIP